MKLVRVEGGNGAMVVACHCEGARLVVTMAVKRLVTIASGGTGAAVGYLLDGRRLSQCLTSTLKVL